MTEQTQKQNSHEHLHKYTIKAMHSIHFWFIHNHYIRGN